MEDYSLEIVDLRMVTDPIALYDVRPPHEIKPQQRLQEQMGPREEEIIRRQAEQKRKQEQEMSAFVELARAATPVIEKVPLHRDYNSMLHADQRHNLSLVCISTVFPPPKISFSALITHHFHLTESTGLFIIVEWTRYPRQIE